MANSNEKESKAQDVQKKVHKVMRSQKQEQLELLMEDIELALNRLNSAKRLLSHLGVGENVIKHLNAAIDNADVVEAMVYRIIHT